MWTKLRRRLECAWISSVVAFGCTARPPSSLAVPGRDSTQPVAFEFYAPNQTAVTEQDVRGRVTVLAFGTSYALATQLFAEELQTLVRTHVPRINVVLVMMEPFNHQVFVDTFKESLGLEYLVLLADDETLRGGGPFGKFQSMPAAVVLDPQGQIAWSAEGTFSMDRIQREIDALQRERP